MSKKKSRTSTSKFHKRTFTNIGVNSKVSKKPKRKLIKHKVRRSQPVHKRFILHPATLLILLGILVLLSGWTYKAVADSFTVSARINAPPLSDGATITSPLQNSTSTVSDISVSGICPDNSYVKLYDNGLFSGVAICSSNTFQISISLFAGSNILQAQDFNITDQAGPVTASVTVYFTAPTPTPNPSPTPPPPGTTNPTSPVTPSPLIAVTDFHYQTFEVGKDYSAQIQLEGGTAPYILNINWGDGSSETLTTNDPSTLTINHIYKSQGYYVIIIKVTDAKHQVRTIQLAALIKFPGSIGIFSNTSRGSNNIFKTINIPPPNIFTLYKNWLWIAWPSLLIVLLMAISFWLGERQEYQNIINKYSLSNKRGYKNQKRRA